MMRSGFKDSSLSTGNLSGWRDIRHSPVAGALFHIANKFAIRHQNEQQLADYDPAFLDWVFWWYLGTVELTNRIIIRQHDKSA